MYWLFGAQGVFAAKDSAMSSADLAAGLRPTGFGTILVPVFFSSQLMFDGWGQTGLAAYSGMQIPSLPELHSLRMLHSWNEQVAAEARHGLRRSKYNRGTGKEGGRKWQR